MVALGNHIIFNYDTASLGPCHLYSALASRCTNPLYIVHSVIRFMEFLCFQDFLYQ